MDPIKNEQDLKEYKTWKAAKFESFIKPYRVTADTWLHGKDSERIQFVVGEEKGCSEKALNVVCNGPLNIGTEYQVIAVSCTSAGCSTTGSLGSFKTEPEDPIIMPVVVSVVVIMIVVVLIFGAILWYRKYYHRKRQEDSTSLNSIDSIPISETPRNRPIKLEHFEEQLINLKKDSKLLFSEEFLGFEECSPKHSTDAAKLDVNRDKNRYVNILPFDHSRVKLLPIDNNGTTDYINANYIPPTVFKYWKEIYEPLKCGEIIIKLTSLHELGKYIIKIFEMKMGDEVRKVQHFFSIGWEDYSADSQPGDVLEFINVVRQEVKPIDKQPMVVHCSGGVGRTGTFIALDIIQQYINDRDLSSEIDIYSLVLRMRNFRRYMVQSEKQYIFIHETIKEIICRKRKLMENGAAIYENTTCDHIYSNVGFVQEENIYMNLENGKLTTVL